MVIIMFNKSKSIIAVAILSSLSVPAMAVNVSMNDLIHTATNTGTISELNAVQPGMSVDEVKEKINSFITRSSIGDEYKGAYSDRAWAYVAQHGWTAPQPVTFAPITPAQEAQARIERFAMRPVHNPDSVEAAKALAHNPLMVNTDSGRRASAMAEAAAVQANATAANTQDDQEPAITTEKATINLGALIQPVAAPAPVVVPDSAQTTAIRENLKQATAAYLHQSDKTGPVGQAMRDTMTSLSQQLKASQQADQFKPLADVVNKANTKAGFEAAKAKPASYDAPQGAQQHDQAVSLIADHNAQAAAAVVTPVTYDAPAGAADADKEGQAKAYELANGEKAQRMLTARQDAQTVTHGKDGVDGAAGKAGRDGVTTVITKADNTAVEHEAAERQAADYTQRKAIVTNSQAIEVQQGEIMSHSRAIASNSAQIERNSQKIEKLSQQQDTDRKAAKAGTANALAVSGLHYVDTDNSIAIGAGTYEGQNAGSIGYRHKFTQNVAATIAASQDSNGGTGAAASLAIGW